MRLVACAALIIGSVTLVHAEESKLIAVRVDLIEALSPKDTTSSLRFQNEFEQVIKTAKAKLEKKLNACGYALETPTTFFDANDPLQAKEKAEAATKNGSWVIIGPRRSNHYILLVKGSGTTPTISLMASATEVQEFGSRHISLSPTNDVMAKAAAIESQRKTSKNSKYASVVSEDCISCIDFSSIFEKEAAKVGMKKVGDFKIKGETPNLQEIVEKLVELKPKIVLVPNFSKISALIISSISEKLKGVLFVGSDGWGDASFGFLQNDSSIQTAKGITVRGFPPIDLALKQFRLGKEISNTGKDLPTSGPGVAILKSRRHHRDKATWQSALWAAAMPSSRPPYPMAQPIS